MNKPLGLSRNPPWKLGETQSAVTGYVGLFSIVLCAILTSVYQFSESANLLIIWDLRKFIGILFVFFSMAFVEIVFFKVYRRNFQFSKPKQVNVKNIWLRTLALMMALTIIWLLFLLSELWFPGFIIFFYFFSPALIVGSFFYFYILEKYGLNKPESDELLIFGKWIVSFFDRSIKLESNSKSHIFNLIRGIVVKGFFIPFMVSSCITFWNYWEIDTRALAEVNLLVESLNPHSLSLLFKASMDLIIVIDVTIATLGYLTSMKILDTQFESVEPTTFGWFVAMICYPPFNFLFQAYVWKYTEVEYSRIVCQSNLAVGVSCCILILILMAVYTWSTVVFGLRFSNLTNRGIICSGPYRWVRHPAYGFKNLSWWIALAPLLVLSPQVPWYAAPGLLVVNAAYYFRALTEERHLLSEEHYQQYCKRVKWRFFPGIV